MDGFWKAIAIVLLAVILGLAVGKQEKDIALLLTMAACCGAAAMMVSYLEPVLGFVWELEALAQLKNGLVGILLKAVGIAFIAELAAMICKDAGNASLGKTLQMLGSAVILSLSIPIFQALLTLIRDILGEL